MAALWQPLGTKSGAKAAYFAPFSWCPTASNNWWCLSGSSLHILWCQLGLSQHILNFTTLRLQLSLPWCRASEDRWERWLDHWLPYYGVQILSNSDCTHTHTIKSIWTNFVAFSFVPHLAQISPVWFSRYSFPKISASQQHWPKKSEPPFRSCLIQTGSILSSDFLAERFDIDFESAKFSGWCCQEIAFYHDHIITWILCLVIIIKCQVRLTSSACLLFCPSAVSTCLVPPSIDFRLQTWH